MIQASKGVLAAWGAALLAAGCSSPESGQNEGSTTPALTATSAAALHADTFVAYFGDERFDMELATADAPEIPFDAIEGPLSALTGEVIEVDLAVESPWTVRHNLSYAAGDDGLQTFWHVVALVGGTEGLSGHLAVSGTAEGGGSISAEYSVAFHGRYPLPGFEGQDDVGLDMSFMNTGARIAEFRE